MNQLLLHYIMDIIKDLFDIKNILLLTQVILKLLLFYLNFLLLNLKSWVKKYLNMQKWNIEIVSKKNFQIIQKKKVQLFTEIKRCRENLSINAEMEIKLENFHGNEDFIFILTREKFEGIVYKLINLFSMELNDFYKDLTD